MALALDVSQTSMILSAYSHELRSQASRVLTAHPSLLYQWHGDHLVFPAVDEDGFDVTLQPDAHGIIVLTGVGVHEHIDGSPWDAVRDALGLARDLLSPDMRVREQRAGGAGYRWVLERRDTGMWRPQSETGLLFWNYFGRRSEHFYQNTQLPGRLASGSTATPEGRGAR
jgi:hypothetical protein